MQKKRIKKLQNLISDTQILLVSKPADIFYLTEFEFLLPEEREAFFIVSKNHAGLVHASFSNFEKDPDFIYFEGTHPKKLEQALQAIINLEKKSDSIVIDSNTLFVNEYDAILESINEIKIIKNQNNLVTELRKTKDQQEIELLKKANHLTAFVMNEIIKELKVGQTENEVTLAIKHKLEKLGVTNLAFPTIVAFGENTARPHHQATDKVLSLNMPVLIDMGAKYNGYCGDMTRTIWFGDQDKKDAEFIKIEKIILEAYEQGVKQIKQLNTTQKLQADHIDKMVRSHIQASGFGEYFIHTTGHGVGIEVHEVPSLNWHNSMNILSNMVITIEPGIYLPNRFGFRYENTLLIESKNNDQNDVIVLTQ